MNSYLIYHQDYSDIPLQDLPPKGSLILCLDPQKRLGSETWAVLECRSDAGEAPPKALGLFWDKEEAEDFAKNRKGN